MKYYVYKITNTVNYKIYIGVHKSMNINSDPYLGSGTRLSFAKQFYGPLFFEREILYEFDIEEYAYIMEEMIVDIDFIKRRDTYNDCLGGKGGGFSPCHKPWVIEKANNTRFLRYGNIHGQMHTKDARNKGMSTKRSRYEELMPGCRTKESREKAILTIDKVMTDKYGYNGAQMHQEGFHEKSVLSKVANSINKYPELKLDCELYDNQDMLVLKSRVYDICEYLYTRSDAIGNRRYVTSKFPEGSFSQGKWKGYRVKLIECSTTIL